MFNNSWLNHSSALCNFQPQCALTQFYWLGRREASLFSRNWTAFIFGWLWNLHSWFSTILMMMITGTVFILRLPIHQRALRISMSILFWKPWMILILLVLEPPQSCAPYRHNRFSICDLFPIGLYDLSAKTFFFLMLYSHFSPILTCVQVLYRACLLIVISLRLSIAF